MYAFQVKENNFKQVITFYGGPVNSVKKDGTKRRIKHTLVKHVIY